LAETQSVPWQGDACSLMDAFRSGGRTPAEELEAVLRAIDNSELNGFSFVDSEAAMSAARSADVSLPFGGLPVGIKELQRVKGWPYTEASLVFKDRVSDETSTMESRLFAAGAIPVAQTTASEFGGLNVSISKLHGITGNPWDPSKTAGGSSGGSSAAVAGGLLTLATGGDGGGSIRIPAGFNGLLGLKGTAGRIPRGPQTMISPMTVVLGCLARSVRDVARFFDVCNGFDSRDPYSLPRVDGWEAKLGSNELAGKRAVIAPTLGNAIVRPEVEELIVAAGERLARVAGLRLVDLDVKLPGLGVEWALANLATLLADLGDLYPDCVPDLTEEIAFGLSFAQDQFNLEMAATVERNRTAGNETMAELFDQVDFMIAATNPDVACPAHVTINTRCGDQIVGPENNGALTIPANISGNPAISIPVGTVDDLPVGMQVIGRHHEDALLLDLALAVERERPWPLVAPGSPK
jgi:aspartyl-tRNA(Asn)/glutamyl-tRNA(Gln) amidotransferase subunit A